MIKKTIFILACALMELAPSGVITYAADQNRPKKIKVLLIDGQKNMFIELWHHMQPAVDSKYSFKYEDIPIQALKELDFKKKDSE